MPDDVSPDVDQRTIDDLINKMLVPPGLGPGPSPEFAQRNPRAAGAMRMKELAEPQARNAEIQQQLERAAMRDKYSNPKDDDVLKRILGK